jgi:hypothetical protein
MGRRVSTAVDSLARAGGLLARLRDGNDAVWQGIAGDVFRAHFNNTLAVAHRPETAAPTHRSTAATGDHRLILRNRRIHANHEHTAPTSAPRRLRNMLLSV